MGIFSLKAKLAVHRGASMSTQVKLISILIFPENSNLKSHTCLDLRFLFARFFPQLK